MSSTYQNYLTIIENSERLKCLSSGFYEKVEILESFIENKIDDSQFNEIIELMLNLDDTYSMLYRIYINATSDKTHMYGWQRNQTYDYRKQSEYIYDRLKYKYEYIMDLLLKNDHIRLRYELNKLFYKIRPSISDINQFNTDIISYIERYNTIIQLYPQYNNLYQNTPIIYHRNVSLCFRRSMFHIYDNPYIIHKMKEDLEILPEQISDKNKKYLEDVYNYFSDLIKKIAIFNILITTYFKIENLIHKDLRIINQILEKNYNLIFTSDRIISDITTYKSFDIIISVLKYIMIVINNYKQVINYLPREDIFTNNVNSIIELLDSIHIDDIIKNIAIIKNIK